MTWHLLLNSLVVAAVTTASAVAAGLFAALCAAASPRRWQAAILLAGTLTLVLPPFLVVNCWLHYLGTTGVWRRWLPLNLFSLGGTIWVLTLLTWPITLILVRSAWQRLQPADLEADPALTGSGFLRRLLLPAAAGALPQAALLSFVLALGNFAVPSILQTKVLPAEAWVRFNTEFDTAGTLKLSLPLMMVAAGLLLWMSRREVQWPRYQSSADASLFRCQLGKGWVAISASLTAALCLLSLGLPLAQIASAKRTWTEMPGALAAGRHQLWNSFLFATVSASILVCLGVVANATRAGRRDAPSTWTRIVAALLWMPFLAPGVLIGIALIAVFNHALSAIFYQSAGIVILAFVIRYLGLGWHSAGHALRTLDPDVSDAARLEGASAIQMLGRVHGKDIGPQLAAAWYLIFVLCLWDVESMILVYPPGRETLALRIFNLLHYGDNAQVNALCLSLLMLAAVPIAIWGLARLIRNVVRRPAIPVLLGALFVVALLSGCRPAVPYGETPLDSRLFTSVRILGSRGVGIGELNKPRSVAVDALDNLYVVDMTGRVQKFSSEGQFLLYWQMPQTDLGKPKGMGRDRDGNIIVVEPHYQRVNHFTPEGKLIAQWGISGTGPGQFKLPRAVATNSKGDLFISEYSGAERVQRFHLAASSPGSVTPQVELVGSIGHAGTGPGEFNRPEGICVDSQDRLYVADSCNHRIQIFSSDGKFIAAYGHAGSGKGELSYPYDICVDAAGRQYVCEFGNSRIQIFNARNEPIEIIGSAGREPGQFNNPWGVALDSENNLYVADSQNHRVQKLIRAQHVVSEVDDPAEDFIPIFHVAALAPPKSSPGQPSAATGIFR